MAEIRPYRPKGNPMVDALEAALQERRREKAAAQGPPEDPNAVLGELINRAGTAKGSSKPEQLLTLDSKTQKSKVHNARTRTPGT